MADNSRSCTVKDGIYLELQEKTVAESGKVIFCLKITNVIIVLAWVQITKFECQNTH